VSIVALVRLPPDACAAMDAGALDQGLVASYLASESTRARNSSGDKTGSSLVE
jgi:hypothetical protein